MAVKTGDFLLINYTLKVKESGETVDTTFDTIAKDANIRKEDATYGPKFVIIGEGWIPKGLEDSLVGLDPGKQTTIELSPEKGYGSRDPAKMRLVSMRRFREKGIDPAPGSQIEFDGRPAVVRAVGAGRVQVDYNHPLAGRTLIYDISVERVVEDENEKILNLISRRIPEISKEKFLLTMDGKNLTIEVPEEAFYLSGLQVAKKAVTSDLQKHLPEVGNISFLETFKRAESRTEVEPTQTPAPPEPPQAGQEAKKEPVVEEETRHETEQKHPPASTKRTTIKTSKRRPRSGSENQR